MNRKASTPQPVGCSDQGISHLKLRSSVVKETNWLSARRILLGVLHATEKRRKNKAALGHLMETFVGKTRTANAKLKANEVKKAKNKGFVGF